MFQKLLPVHEPPPGAASRIRLWVNTLYVQTIEHGTLENASTFDSFKFALLQETPAPQDETLKQLLLASDKREAGCVVPAPTGRFLWIKPSQLFAIGSFIPEDSTTSFVVIWTRPPSDKAVLTAKEGIHVLLPHLSQPTNPFAFEDTTVVRLASWLGIELDTPA